MKEIKLSKGFVAQVDDEDFEYLNQFKWYVYIDRVYRYALRRDNKSRKRIKMHRVILNASDNILVDHIDHNGLNNQRNNIRLCTNTQNQWNMKGRRNGFKGVSIEKYSFRAAIKYQNKTIHLGSFKTEEDAAKAYDKKATELFGEFAYLNFR
jgi:hypothetical protein